MTRHVAHVKHKLKQGFFLGGGSPRERIHLEDLDLDRRIKLK